MSVLRLFLTAVTAMTLFGASPANAQFFFKSADLSGPRVTGAEPGIVGQAMPGATPEELRAALVWNLRAALNVAALQCDFAPTLRTVSNYNALLKNHDAELDETHAALLGYFVRISDSKRAGQSALDQFFTRAYSGFSVVSAQYPFCQTAGKIAYEALFAPRGTLGDVAQNRMRELRNSLVPWGEQQFLYRYHPPMPLIREFANERCWRKGAWYERRCGAYYAQRHASRN